MPGSRTSQLFAALALLTASGILLAADVVYVVVALLAALVGPGTVLGTFLDLAFPYLAAGVVLTILVAVSGLGVAWVLARGVVDLGTGRLQAVAEELERHEPDIEGLVSVVTRGERPPPKSDEEALADLRERYAGGEIDDGTFERELERILGEEPEDADPARTGRTGRPARSGEMERVDHR